MNAGNHNLHTCNIRPFYHSLEGHTFKRQSINHSSYNNNTPFQQTVAISLSFFKTRWATGRDRDWTSMDKSIFNLSQNSPFLPGFLTVSVSGSFIQVVHSSTAFNYQSFTYQINNAEFDFGQDVFELSFLNEMRCCRASCKICLLASRTSLRGNPYLKLGWLRLRLWKSEGGRKTCVRGSCQSTRTLHLLRQESNALYQDCHKHWLIYGFEFKWWPPLQGHYAATIKPWAAPTGFQFNTYLLVSITLGIVFCPILDMGVSFEDGGF